MSWREKYEKDWSHDAIEKKDIPEGRDWFEDVARAYRNATPYTLKLFVANLDDDCCWPLTIAAVPEGEPLYSYMEPEYV